MFGYTTGNYNSFMPFLPIGGGFGSVPFCSNGFSEGMMAFGMISNIANSIFTCNAAGFGAGYSSGSTSTPRQTREEKIESLDSEISKLQDRDAEEELDKSNKTYKSNIDKAQTAYDKADKRKTELASSETVRTNKIKELKAKKANEITAGESEELTKLQSEQKEYETFIGTGEGSVQDYKTKLETAKKERDDAIKEIQDKIDAKIKELKDKKEALEKAQKAEEDNKMLDKADGNVINRIGGKDNATVRKIIREFRLAKEKYDSTSPSNKELRAAQAKTLSEIQLKIKKVNTDNLNPTVKSGYNYVTSWKPEETQS